MSWPSLGPWEKSGQVEESGGETCRRFLFSMKAWFLLRPLLGVLPSAGICQSTKRVRETMWTSESL